LSKLGAQWLATMQFRYINVLWPDQAVRTLIDPAGALWQNSRTRL